MKPVINVVGALIIRDGLYLIAQRPAAAVQPLLWEFPGGRVRPGETDEDALKRKLMDLMGIEIQVGQQILHVQHSYDEYDMDFRVYECSVVSDEIRDIKVHDHRWVSEEDLTNYQFPAADQRTFDQLLMTPI